MNAHGHIHGDRLELYILSHLAPAEQEEIEDHLLICEHCRQEVTAVEEFRSALASALRKTDREITPRRRPNYA